MGGERLGDSQKVLIVEDDPVTAKMIEHALNNAGFQTIVALDGFKAGAYLGAFKPMVMTLDLQIPGLGGFDVLRFVRDSPEISNTRILIVSAMPESELEAALRAGDDEIMTKPIRCQLLVEKVKQLAGQAAGLS